MKMTASARRPLPPLVEMVKACAEQRANAITEIRGNPELRGMRWMQDREPCLLAIDADGNRLNDGSWVAWKRRKREVVELYERYPQAVRIIVDSGINVRERSDDVDYTPVFWQAVLWESAPAEESIDALVRKHTAFKTLAAMFEASSDYRPSVDVREPHMRAIADAYDQLAEERGDPRRAYRYGL